MKINVKEALVRAAAGAESTATSVSIVRPSVAGTPLLPLVLDQLVLPKLPQPTTTQSSLVSLSSAMSIGCGFLFESLLTTHLRNTYEGWELQEQVSLNWGSFVGTADVVLLNHELQQAIVIDAKCVRADNNTDIKKRKLSSAWNYPTQLAIYWAAVAAKYPDYKVESQWAVWNLTKGKLSFFAQTAEDSERLANEADNRANRYLFVKGLLEGGSYAEAAAVVCSDVREGIPPKAFFYGNLGKACKFHYSPYADLFFPPAEDDEDDEGLPIVGEQLTKLVEALMRDAYSGSNLPTYTEYLTTLGYKC